MAVSVAASRLLPGAPVVSISTYVALPVCTIGVAEGVGVTEGVPLGVRVTEGVPLGVSVPDLVPLGEVEGVGDAVGEVDGVMVADWEAPCETLAVGEGVDDGAAPEGDPLTVREPLVVPEPLRVPEGVPEPLRVPVEDAPEDTEAVLEGEGSVTPITDRGPAYIVPALATEFQAAVGNVPAVVPVRTLVSVRIP